MEPQNISEKGNARSSGYDRADSDWYVEPRRAIDALLDVETFEEIIWDPAVGGGNITKACRDRGFVTRGSDIRQRGAADFCEDFLFSTEKAPSVITNPPFNLAVEFALHALTFAGKVAILQRLSWLEGERRYRRLFSRGQLARVWQFRSRISMPPGNSDVEAKGGSVAFAWFVFEREHAGSWQGGWLP